MKHSAWDIFNMTNFDQARFGRRDDRNHSFITTAATMYLTLLAAAPEPSRGCALKSPQPDPNSTSKES